MMATSTIIHRTYQCKARVKKNGHVRLSEVAMLCRYLYNAALQERIDTYRYQRANPNLDFPNVGLYHQYRELTGIRKDDERYREISLRVTRGALIRLDRAFKAFFRRIKNGEIPGFPRFQGKGRYTCIETHGVQNSWVKLNDDRTVGKLKIKGLPIIRFKSSRPLPDGKPVSLKINLHPTGAYVNLTYKEEIDHLPQVQFIVGIDAGVVNRLTLSNGKIVKSGKKDRKKERRLQRAASRCKRGSNTRRKRVRALAKHRYRERIRNRNECHRITTDIVRNNQLIAVEALKIKNMTKSASGSIENPGKNVSQKRGLNRNVLEQTWGVLRTQLAYKAEWAGRKYVEVDPKYTSQTCSVCGVVSPDSRKSQSVFRCVACDNELNADLNASHNILQRALKAEGWDFVLVSLTSELSGVDTERYCYAI